MIVSVHIPKTAGSRFRQILQNRYGSRVALYYGQEDPRTHPLLQRKPKEFDAAMLRDLEAAGIRILHGHIRAQDMAPLLPDPARYWVWLREPVERTISHYHFLQREEQRGNHLHRTIRQEALSLEAFAALEQLRAFQSRYCAPFSPAQFGFVGVSELFPLLLPTLGLKDTARSGNVNAGKPMAPGAARRALAPVLAEDVALYSEAMELAMRRLRTRDRRRPSLYSLLRLWPARLIAADRSQPQEAS